MSKIKNKFRGLPCWIKGGITGALVFLVLWNFLFIIAYIFIIPQLWEFLFYIAYPIMHPIVKLMNIFFGACYTASSCFFRLPVIFILISAVEGFILGMATMCFQRFSKKILR